MNVLGIDAAWTITQPSGIALVTRKANGWTLAAVSSSYAGFSALAKGETGAGARPLGSAPDAAKLLAAAQSLTGGAIDLVAVDMPLARSPIVSRRVSDDAVSRAYGARKCSTHTPSALRPGRISDDLRLGFEASGYPLQTTSVTAPGLIEVYPHPALVELARAAERLPYKASKVRTYWRSMTPAERRTRLLQQWSEIVVLLNVEIAGVAQALPPLSASASGWEMKAYEDALDAVVCAWVGTCALEGRATSFGDEDAAIWIPKSDPMSYPE